MNKLRAFSVVLLLLLASTQAFAQVDCDNPYNPLLNCGFESGDFTGWTVNDLADPFQPAAVTGAGFSYGFGFFLTAPTQGSLLSINGFDGGGPDAIEYFQEVTIPANAADLVFDYQAAWDLITFCGSCTGSRVFSVEIQPMGGGAPIISTIFLTADPGTENLDTGPMIGTVPLGAVANQQVRIVFIWEIPERFTGPAQFTLDNVNITAVAPPIPTLSNAGLISLILLTLLLAGAGLRRLEG